MADSGVVDPLRIPDWFKDDVKRGWRDTPLAARIFVSLAVVDVVSRSLGILQPPYNPGFDLFGLYAMLIPHDLWVLLPAVLVLRRPDAARATPFIFWGAVVVATLTVVERPLENVAGGSTAFTTLALEISILASLAFLVAWILIARGIAELNPRAPTPQVAGLSNLVLGIGVLALIVELGRSLATQPDTGLPGIDGLLVLGNLVAAARLGAWLYLLWIVIRGIGDPRRPAWATLAAAIGAAMTGLLDAATTFAAAAMTAAQSPIPLGGASLGDLTFAFGLLSSGVGQALLVVAFALGLAEPPVPYAPPLGTESEPSAEAGPGPAPDPAPNQTPTTAAPDEPLA
jgi:hypothetical protein